MKSTITLNGCVVVIYFNEKQVGTLNIHLLEFEVKFNEKRLI